MQDHSSEKDFQACLWSYFVYFMREIFNPRPVRIPCPGEKLFENQSLSEISSHGTVLWSTTTSFAAPKDSVSLSCRKGKHTAFFTK